MPPSKEKSTTKKPASKNSRKAGLVFPVGRIRRYLKKDGRCKSPPPLLPSCLPA
jgi:hypothetical protein